MVFVMVPFSFVSQLFCQNGNYVIPNLKKYAKITILIRILLLLKQLSLHKL